MSYAMLLSYLWCDLKKDDRPVKLAVKWLDKNFTVQANTNAQDGGQQGLYYYYRVMAKALTAYGDKSFAGHEWGKQLADAIIAKQMPDGSWINPKDRWGEGDPSMVTAYSLTSLALARQSMK
jgi:squalene-hopene/tetraprenyl-beta-curcumene cyclase